METILAILRFAVGKKISQRGMGRKEEAEKLAPEKSTQKPEFFERPPLCGPLLGIRDRVHVINKSHTTGEIM